MSGFPTDCGAGVGSSGRCDREKSAGDNREFRSATRNGAEENVEKRNVSGRYDPEETNSGTVTDRQFSRFRRKPSGKLFTGNRARNRRAVYFRRPDR